MPHIFSNKDSKLIAALGYGFSGIEQRSFARFMRKNYLGFDLVALLQQVEQLMAPQTPLHITRVITVTGTSLQIQLENSYTSEDDALLFDRRFYKENGYLKVSHEYLVFPVAARNQGLSKKVLKASLEQYLNMGVTAIEVMAGLSSGAYVWGRHGFTAVNQSEMKRILTRTKSELPDEQYDIVKIIYDAYYDNNPSGADFQIRRWADLPFMKKVLMNPKSQWQGRLDLTNHEQLRKFEVYVSS